jgi:histidyl-tRNA synthetase
MSVESLGFAEPEIDAELIALSARLWSMLGIKSAKLELNTIGTSESRQAYKAVLVDYFGKHRELLDEDSLRRLERNPLRILDSKNPELAELIKAAPLLSDYLDAESQAHFERVKALLGDVGVAFTLNPRLVRGLDYYSRTVFEWLTDRLGSQSAVCSGGRYDGLVEQLGGRPTPAVGWALGIERIVELMQAEGVAAPGAAGCLSRRGRRCGAPVRIQARRGAAHSFTGPEAVARRPRSWLQGPAAQGRQERGARGPDHR